MKDKQEFIDAMDIQQNTNGHWYVNGSVRGGVRHVDGSVGEVDGEVCGSVNGLVWGKINGREWKFVEDNDE